ncbi:hypothetical protein CLV30_12921 [Haloactinopolyspora alba]|uniref:Uncharacterized protein n=2 Tax=Haloactinopolyspora alba TaxID=648780 RepID=A0A2P8DEC4_9ACTN|nr:hypothetical protein CLV30_12921 [Haloactinopolyspora alba]
MAAAVTVAAVVAAAVTDGHQGVTVEPATPRTGMPADSAGQIPDEPTDDDVRFLDDYARELGLVMSRARGPEPEAFARQVDGPGPDVRTMRLSGSAHDGGAEVVLRLRTERTRTGWFGSVEARYRVSACYRWVLGESVDDFRPERLSACPAGPPAELGRAPVEPRLPDGLYDRLSGGLAARKGPVTPEALLADVRTLYVEAARAEQRRGGVRPERLIDVDDALDRHSVVVKGEAVGVSVGFGQECMMVRAAAGEIDVWVPDRISLQPGEIGCSASAAAAPPNARTSGG